MPIYKTKNENFFKKWSAEMAYVLGFFAADGTMIKNKREAHFIEFSNTDKNLLEKIKKTLNSNHKISFRKRNKNWKQAYRLQIGSRVMFNDLTKIGLTQNKTKIMALPKIPNKYFSHFIRGYFDGDGNVWFGLINKKRKKPYLAIQSVFTSGSKHFLQSLKICLENFGLNGGYMASPKSFYRLVYSVNNSLKLYDLMYNRNNTDLYLKRKRIVFEKFIKTRGPVV